MSARAVGVLLCAVYVAGQCRKPQRQVVACVGHAVDDACVIELDSGALRDGVCATNRRCGLYCNPLPRVPRTEAPDTDAPATGVPETDTPSAAPPTSAPATLVPETDAPETDAPETDVPETDAPETDAPETDVPDTDAPETDVPPTPAPETESPDGRRPAVPVLEEDVTCFQQPLNNGGGISQPCQDTHLVPLDEAPAFAHPRVFATENGLLEMHMSVEMHVIDTGAFQMNVRAWCIDGECGSGPMIKAYPGDTVVVTLTNTLDDTAPEEETPDGDGLNDLRHANVTNLHTHGLHVDPSEDNVVIGVGPKGVKTYTYHIPDNHLPGTHWYHAHVHGSTAMQVMGGLVGMFLIEVADSLPTPPAFPTFATARALSAWEAMPVSYMMVTHVSLCSCNPTDDGFRITSYPELRALTGDNTPLRAALRENADGSQTTDVMLVNGLRQPVREMRVGVWNRFEVVNALGDIYLELEVRTGVAFRGGGEAACAMRLLSMDGVFLYNGVRATSLVLVSPAGRVGVAVMCDTPGTYYFQTSSEGRASGNAAGFLQNLMTLSVSAAGGEDGARDAPAWAASEVHRPHYLEDLRNVGGVVSTWELSTGGALPNGHRALGVGVDCTAGPTCPRIEFGFPESDDDDRHLANFPYRHVGRLCDLEDVVLQNGGGTPHPMHFHVNHFQIISLTGDNGEDLTTTAPFNLWGEVGDWRDTIPNWGGALRIRHALDEHGGNIMVHCHYLLHEDQGMMDRYWVAGINDDGSAEVPVCTAATRGGNCDGSVPPEAFLNAYPRVPGERRCTVFRQNEDDLVPLPPSLD